MHHLLDLTIDRHANRNRPPTIGASDRRTGITALQSAPLSVDMDDGEAGRASSADRPTPDLHSPTAGNLLVGERLVGALLPRGRGTG